VSHDYPYFSSRLTFHSNWPYTPPNTTESNDAKAPPIQTQALILGLGSMFNHSSLYQNVGWERDIKNLLITYTTL